MKRLPILPGWDIIKLLKSFGFEVKRQKGNHTFVKHQDGRQLSFPFIEGKI